MAPSYAKAAASTAATTANKLKHARRRQAQQHTVIYNNPYSSDSSDAQVETPSKVQAGSGGLGHNFQRNQQRAPKRRRNSNSFPFIHGDTGADTTVFAFYPDRAAAVAGDAALEIFDFNGNSDEDEEEEEEDDEDDDEEDDEDCEHEEDDDEAEENDEEQDDEDLDHQLAAAHDGDDDDAQIELEEEAAIVEELSFHDDFDPSATVDISNFSSSSEDDDEDLATDAFDDTLFMEKDDPTLRYLVSTAQTDFRDSDDDSFVLDYLFSSGGSSDEEEDDTKEDVADHSGRSPRRERKRLRNKRHRQHGIFSDDLDESELDAEANGDGGFDLKTEDMSSGIDARIRRNGAYYEPDDGESTDEDVNIPPPSLRRAGHRATEILESSAAASRPPRLGSWVLPVGRHIGVINGLQTRTLSPPPFPRGNSMSEECTLPAAAVAAAAAAAAMVGLGDGYECNDVVLEEFIYMSELDNEGEEDDEDDDDDDDRERAVLDGPATTPVWAGRFHSKFPLSAFRARSSMQYRSI
ncbi:transcription factor CRF1-domain-containing protein [Limtongia smithiae]|uniref:transcription factor CRF1-domain-containing protein n=1 Tax=Limtongia smithiae TaxID=1125753 RepID=UPI0034D01DA5